MPYKEWTIDLDHGLRRTNDARRGSHLPGILLICAFFFTSCITGSNRPPSARGYLTSDEWENGVSVPYYAPKGRGQQIEQAAHDLRLGTTEAGVLARMGPPDFKAPAIARDKHSGEMVTYAEFWYYIVSVERTFPLSPGPEKNPQDKLVCIEITDKSNPRIVTEIMPSL